MALRLTLPNLSIKQEIAAMTRAGHAVMKGAAVIMNPIIPVHNQAERVCANSFASRTFGHWEW